MEKKIIVINDKDREYLQFTLTETELKEIERTPSFEDAMDDDDNAFSCFNDYSGGTYICDAITEIADGMVDIYNGDLWENAPKVSEYVEQAMSEGLVDTSSRNFSLTNAFQAGEYEYYTAALYKNLDELACNYILNYLNGTEICASYVGTEEFDIESENIFEEIISRLDGKLDDVSNVDNNDRFWDLEEMAMEMLDEIFEEMLDENEGLIIAIEENFEDTLQDWIDENEEEEEEED